jgi:hypothetical protein
MAVQMNTDVRGDSNRQPDERAELKELYDTYRTARLGEKYYGCQLASKQSWALFYEVCIAIGTVIGFVILAFDIFSSLEDLNKPFIPDWLKPLLPDWLKPILTSIKLSTVVLTITGLSAVAATVKPFLAFEKKIEHYSKLFGAYSRQTAALKRIVSSVRIQHGLTEELRQKIETIRDALDELATLEDPRPKREHLETLQEEVRQEIPLEALYWPEGEKAGSINDEKCA